MTAHRLIAFADGENLVFRYQDMVKRGAKPKSDVLHVPDLLVWHPKFTETFVSDITRISYYQTCIGDEPKLTLAKQTIKDVRYTYTTENGSEGGTSGALIPRVFKKENKSAKTKSVDINLTVDMLRYTSNPQLDVLMLFSGDGDYLPLIEEVARTGKQVWVAAFSDGLNSSMKLAADEFFSLDEFCFE
jgi:uncharacterized LabA/DUF88 family protein